MAKGELNEKVVVETKRLADYGKRIDDEKDVLKENLLHRVFAQKA